jgi:hypothetical protein
MQYATNGANPNTGTNTAPNLKDDLVVDTWSHIAISVDLDAGTITHYLDGEINGAVQTVDVGTPALPPYHLELGRYGTITSLRSRFAFDDLVIAPYPMSAAAIERLFDSGVV